MCGPLGGTVSNITVGALNSKQRETRVTWRTPVHRISVATTTVVSGLVLIGHFGGIDWLTNVYPDSPRTAATTAFLFIAIAASTGLAWRARQRRSLRWVSPVLAGMTATTGIVLLVAWVSGNALNTATILHAPEELAAHLEASYRPATASPLTLLGIISLGVSVILTTRKAAAAAQFCALGALAISLTTAAGYLMGSRSIYSNPPAFALAGFPEFILFLSATTAIVAVNGDRGITADVSDNHLGGRIARRVLPAVLIVPIVIGWLQLVGQDLNFYGADFGLSLMIASHAITLGAVVLIGTRWLNKVDRERTLAEAESLERAYRFSDILENAAEGILTCNSARKITTANSRAELVFQQHNLVGMNIQEVIPNGLEALRELEESSYESGSKTNLRMVGETSSGRLFPIEASIAMRHFSGERTFTLIFRDVSQQVRAESRIRALNERLEEQIKERTEQLNRTAGDLEAFSYRVSHELRAPLRAMSGFARIVTDDFGSKLPPDARHYLNRIQENAAFMAEMIDGLLEFSRIDRIARSQSDLDLASLIEGEIDRIRPTLARRAVDFKIGEMPSCNGDPVLMQRVIANLLANAVKFTKDCDPAVIEAGFDEELAAYFIRDNGVGFDSARAGKLFEVFQRLHPRDSYSGSGIGLALARRIVEKHGGSIWAKAKPNHGATFYFTVDEGNHLIQSELSRTGISA